MCKYELPIYVKAFESDRITDRQTRPKLYTFAGGQKLGERWVSFPSQCIEQSITLSSHVVHFRHVAPLRNQNASKATRVESRCQISHFLTP